RRHGLSSSRCRSLARPGRLSPGATAGSRSLGRATSAWASTRTARLERPACPAASPCPSSDELQVHPAQAFDADGSRERGREVDPGLVGDATSMVVSALGLRLSAGMQPVGVVLVPRPDVLDLSDGPRARLAVGRLHQGPFRAEPIWQRERHLVLVDAMAIVCALLYLAVATKHRGADADRAPARRPVGDRMVVGLVLRVCSERVPRHATDDAVAL